MQRSSVVFPQPDGPMNAVTAFGGIFKRDVVQDGVCAVGKLQLIDLDHCGVLLLLGQHGGIARGGFGNGFGHLQQTYHDKRLLDLSRNTIDVSAMTMTSARNTNAAPYCTRSVYSFCGIFELTT